MRSLMKDQIVAKFSGGRSSAMMVCKMIENGNPPDLALFNNTGLETHETYEFINACDEKLFKPAGIKLVWLEWALTDSEKAAFKVVDYETASRNGEVFKNYLTKSNFFLPSHRTRTCTINMKVLTAKRYLRAQGWTYDGTTKAVGFRADEFHRVSRMKARNNAIEEGGVSDDFYAIAPLSEYGVTKDDVFSFWKKQKKLLKLPFDVSDGALRLSNCVGCFFCGIGELVRVAKEQPKYAQWWADVEREHRRIEQNIGKTKPAHKNTENNEKRRVIWIEKHLDRKATDEEKVGYSINDLWTWDNIIELSKKGNYKVINEKELHIGGCGDGECGLDV